MARKTSSRLQKRKEAEAAEKKTTTKKKTTKKKKTATKKKKTTKRTKRSKEKVTQRKRLVWAVFSGNLKEEARFPYDQRAAAEEKIKQLKTKSKKMYFIQPVKEPIAEAVGDEE